MAIAPVQQVRSRQPDQFTNLAFGNPLTRGLVFLWNGATPQYAIGNPGTPGAKIPAAQTVGTPLARAIGPNGATPAFGGAGGYKWAWSLPSSPAECTLFAWAASNASAGTYSLIGCCDSAGGNPLFRLDYGGAGTSARLQLRGNSGTVLNLAANVGEVAWTDDFIVGVYRSGTGTKEIWVNGVRYNTGTTDIGAITLNTTDVGVLSRATPTQHLNGRLYLGGIYDRALTGREIQELSANPWQIFEPEPIQIYWAAAAGGATYTLTAAQGSFSLSGQASTLQAARLLTAAQGSFTLTGQAATLKAARLLTAAQGSYTLTGQDATLTYTGAATYTLVAAQGSFALTGQAATLKASRVLSSAFGSFALTGHPASFSVSSGLLRGRLRRGRAPIWHDDGSKKKCLRRRCATKRNTSRYWQQRPTSSPSWTNSESCGMRLN
jgi:hypothetical protein